MIVQGSDGDGSDNTDRAPNQNYVAVTNGPFVIGDFAGSMAANQLRLTRGATGAGAGWVGVVTVVECLRNCTTSGFRLLDVQRVAHTGANVTGTNASAAWTLARVMLMGGFNGAGCDTARPRPPTPRSATCASSPAAPTSSTGRATRAAPAASPPPPAR